MLPFSRPKSTLACLPLLLVKFAALPAGAFVFCLAVTLYGASIRRKYRKLATVAMTRTEPKTSSAFKGSEGQASQTMATIMTY